MNNVPKEIFLSVDIESYWTDDFSDLDPEFVYWSKTRQDKTDIQYRLVERVFYIDEVRKWLIQLKNEEISLSMFVQMMNEKATGISIIDLLKLEGKL